MKKIILILLVLLPISLIAQSEKKLELSLGGEFLFPVDTDSDEDYLIGGSAGVGYIMSPIVVFSGSVGYYQFSSDDSEYLQEEPGSVLGVSLRVKRYIFQGSSHLKPYLRLDVGFLFPLSESTSPIYPEICGGMGLEFFVNTDAFIFIDAGYLVLTVGDWQKFISGRIGVNLHI